MGSFGGVNIDTDNWQNVIKSIQEKGLFNMGRPAIMGSPAISSEKLLRTNVTGVLNQDVPYNLLLTASEQDANRTAYEKYKIELERQRAIDLKSQQEGYVNPLIFNNLPYKQGGILKAGTSVKGDLYAQDLRPVDGQYNEWLRVKVPNSFGGTVNIDSKFINYDMVTDTKKQDKDHKVKLIVIGAFVLGLLLSKD